MNISHPDPSKCYAIVKPENLVLGRTYYFKQRYWKHYQVAKIMYVSPKYVVMMKYHPDDTKATEYCLDHTQSDAHFTSVR